MLRIAVPVYCVVGAALLAAPVTRAGAQASTVGASADALPGVERVGSAAQPSDPWTVAGGPDYGYTGDVLKQGDSHSQVGFDVAASIRAIDLLALAFRTRARIDWHSHVDGEETGFAAHTRLKARVGPWLDGPVKLGVEAALTVPAAAAFADAMSGLTPELLLLLTSQASGHLTVMGQLGFRLDRQVKAVDDARDLSGPDRVALGLGEANAVPLGLGASYRLTGLELLGEWSWDLRVGEHAPDPLESTMWLRAGARMPLAGLATLGLLAGVNLAARPDVELGSPLQEIAPRLWVGLRMASDFGKRTEHSAPEAPAGVDGHVRGADGAALGGVAIVAGGVRVQSAADGSFTLAGLPPGSIDLVATLDGYAEMRTPVTVMPGGRTAAPVEITLSPAPIDWATVVSGPDGKPLADARALLTRDALSFEGTSGADGHVEIKAVPAGAYHLRIEKEGFAPVEVELVLGPGAAQAPAPAVQLDVALPEGQIRGTVREFDGGPLRATARVVPLGKQVRANAHGEFAIDVPPGKYKVVVSAPGFKRQTRKAQVEDHGVTVLIVDLRRKK